MPDSTRPTEPSTAAGRDDSPAAPELSAEMHYHFLGIGGVGMSALAQVLHHRGVGVSGSDAQWGEAMDRLKAAGIKVSMGHGAEALEGADAVVYTSALKGEHPIWEEVAARGLPRYHRSELLGALTRSANTLAVTGTHGKTTSSACLAHVLTVAGWDPTALVGGFVPQFQGANARVGASEWLVVEADESDGSFTRLSPQAVLLTNIEAEHLDHHGSMEGVEASFREFLGRLPPGGLLVYCLDDPGAAKAAAAAPCRRISYGTAEQADVRVSTRIEAGGMRLTLTHQGKSREIGVILSGRHNGLNMAGVYGLCLGLGLSGEEAARGLAGFQGVARRQQFIGRVGDCSIFDDYAHHPTEIEATLSMFLELYGEPVTVVFQPHLYSRTADFAAEFARALRPASRIFITDIYGAREEPIAGVSSRLILERLAGHPAARHLPDWRAAPELLLKGLPASGVLLTMGAGDITGLGPLLLEKSGEFEG